jgi:hypothetical protein
MPVGGTSNKAQAGVVGKKGKANSSIQTDEDMAHKANEAAKKKALQEAAAKMAGKKKK